MIKLTGESGREKSQFTNLENWIIFYKTSLVLKTVIGIKILTCGHASPRLLCECLE
jgi:hypothetical protein